MSSYLKIEYAVRWLPVSSERSDAKLSKAQIYLTKSRVYERRSDS